LSWASPEYEKTDKKLHECAVDFIQALFEKHSKTAPTEFEKVEIFKQDNNIDVLCIINDKYAILIEDKTRTENHSNQLARYLEDVKKRNYKEEDILPIYFKTEDQGDYSKVLKAGYQPFLRADIIEILESYTGDNSILVDYRDYLQSISVKTESYKSLSIDEWGWYSWVGFYLRLQNELGSGSWGYVANPKGGFLGFCWNFQGDDNCEQYLQLEQDKFCFKIWVNNISDRKSLRKKWHETIKDKSQEHDLNLVRPARFGNGKYMTVSIYDGEYREHSNGLINIDKTVSRLRKAGELLGGVRENA